MKDPVLTPRPHPEGLYRPDQPSRAAGLYCEVGPQPAASEHPEEAPDDSVA